MTKLSLVQTYKTPINSIQSTELENCLKRLIGVMYTPQRENTLPLNIASDKER